MSGLNDAAPLPVGMEPEPSRRSVLRGAAATGAAGIAAAAFMGGAVPAAAATKAAPKAAREPGTARAPEPDPVVVHIRNAGAGEMDVFRGTSCTRVRDKEMAARLIRASS
jgi:hypothetical protein